MSEKYATVRESNKILYVVKDETKMGGWRKFFYVLFIIFSVLSGINMIGYGYKATQTEDGARKFYVSLLIGSTTSLIICILIAYFIGKGKQWN